MLDIMQTVLVPVRVHQLLILSDSFFLLELVSSLLGLNFSEVIGYAETWIVSAVLGRFAGSDVPAAMTAIAGRYLLLY
jgi:hypothetical protein